MSYRYEDPDYRRPTPQFTRRLKKTNPNPKWLHHDLYRVNQRTKQRRGIIGFKPHS